MKNKEILSKLENIWVVLFVVMVLSGIASSYALHHDIWWSTFAWLTYIFSFGELIPLSIVVLIKMFESEGE
jgi:membrane protein CcdC involved in cytochrome C biogenesis